MLAKIAAGFVIGCFCALIGALTLLALVAVARAVA